MSFFRLFLVSFIGYLFLNSLGAAPRVTRCDVVPGVLAPGQRIAVVVEGTGIASGTATVDFIPLGGTLEQLLSLIHI